MAPTLGDADPWGAEGSGRVMRSMTPVHSLWDLTGFAAMDKESTCQSVPILVVLPGQERLVAAGLLADLRCILLFVKHHTLLFVKLHILLSVKLHTLLFVKIYSLLFVEQCTRHKQLTSQTSMLKAGQHMIRSNT